jgi:hypothetical protein
MPARVAGLFGAVWKGVGIARIIGHVLARACPTTMRAHGQVFCFFFLFFC